MYREIAPNAFYSGSIDYTSANPWGELKEERVARIHDPLGGGKGLIEWDLESGTHTFHRIAVTRPLVDLPRIDATTMTAADVDAALQEAVTRASVPIDERIARLVVTDIPRNVIRQLDQKAIRELKRRALHFHLDLRRPEVVRKTASGAPGRRPSLAEVLREKLGSRQIAAGISRDEFVTLGLEYLHRADLRESAAAGAAE